MTKEDNNCLDIVKSEKISNRDLIRKSFVDVFHAIGGIDHLQQFALDNPKQYYALLCRLFPESKVSKDDTPKHETFIQMIINEDKAKSNQANKPIEIIEVT